MHSIVDLKMEDRNWEMKKPRKQEFVSAGEAGSRLYLAKPHKLTQMKVQVVATVQLECCLPLHKSSAIQHLCQKKAFHFTPFFRERNQSKAPEMLQSAGLFLG